MTVGSPGDKARTYRKALRAAAEQAIRPLEDPAHPLLIRVGLPTKQQLVNYDEIVAVMRTAGHQEPATMGPQRSREQALTATVVVSVFRPGQDGDLDDTDLFEMVSDRGGELLDALEEFVRVTDTTLGGVVRWCFASDVEIDEPDERLSSGRNCLTVGEFVAAARITS